MAHDVGLHATKGFVLHTIKQEVNPLFLIHARFFSQRFLVIYHGVELNMLGDIVLNPPASAMAMSPASTHGRHLATRGYL